ncbi:MAG: 4-(cytidine 5'-diphospho)-2-C-methyl-D-erythritol kinase [Parasphingorhabdus sp.]
MISVSPSQGLELEISGPFADGLDIPENLVLKAARLLKKEYDVSAGAKLHLVKNLPIASGIGGGSADAAAALRLLNHYWNLNKSQFDLEKVAETLGADVPACISSETAIGFGIGQDLKPLKNRPFAGMHVLLANPLVTISTKDIFEKWNGVDIGPLNFDDVSALLIDGRNDLQSIAMALSDSIAPLLTAIETTDPLAARMSGSGATCFGIYKNAELALTAEKSLHSSIDKIWTMTGTLR